MDVNELNRTIKYQLFYGVKFILNIFKNKNCWEMFSIFEIFRSIFFLFFFYFKFKLIQFFFQYYMFTLCNEYNRYIKSSTRCLNKEKLERITNFLKSSPFLFFFWFFFFLSLLKTPLFFWG